jgi:hypothetical protein
VTTVEVEIAEVVVEVAEFGLGFLDNGHGRVASLALRF